ncbi:hypothetical protein EMPG_11527 [Blastomyces silverae]|uniref:Carboxypeptidase n=1 Tax=Blastomyces silverae TaxID=2060906 RepID=A0A0H1BR05_9EURO|nr:hypothetical protein EMPG_11527 [Blastomyces silverae]
MNWADLLSFLSFIWAVPNLSPSGTHNRTGTDTARFRVEALPGNPILPSSYAGLIPIPGREEGNALFFWLFEAENYENDENLIIFFKGGPGCSSVIGALSENGPLAFVENDSIPIPNPHSWTKWGNVLYIDQPVGTGFSTSSSLEPIATNEEVTSNLYTWLTEFYREFPYLLEKKTHLMGESYAGIFVPYFASKIVEHQDSLPINLQSISIGNGIIGNNAVMADVTVGAYLEMHAHSLNIPQDIIDSFSLADHICKFDAVLDEANEYPPLGPISVPGNPENLNFRRDEPCRAQSDSDAGPMAECNIYPTAPSAVMESILNSTCHGPCATFSTAADYFETRSNLTHDCFNLYNIKYDCNTFSPLDALTAYLNRADVQTSLHIPQPHPKAKSTKSENKPYPFQACNSAIIRSLLGPTNRPTPPAYSIIPELISTHNISTHIYHGKLDMLVNHIAVEVVLQNMTWNGLQGFQRRPGTPFSFRNSSSGARSTESSPNDGTNNSSAGIWTAERGLTYHLFNEAGHGVPSDQPEEMFWYVKEVVLGGSE